MKKLCLFFLSSFIFLIGYAQSVGINTDASLPNMQEVEQAAKAVGYDFSGYEAPKNIWSLYTIRYAEFVVPLVKAMQEQQEIKTNQQKQIDLLEKKTGCFGSQIILIYFININIKS